MGLISKVKKTLKDIPAIFVGLRKNKLPILARIFGTFTVIYALSPIDLIPDFIPVLGYLDDIIILPLLVLLTRLFIPNDVMDECRKESENIWKNGKPKKWYYSFLIVAIWIVAIILIYFWLIK